MRATHRIILQLDSFNESINWGFGYGRPYVTIVAMADGTDVEVTPSQNTAAGNGVPAGTAVADILAAASPSPTRFATPADAACAMVRNDSAVAGRAFFGKPVHGTFHDASARQRHGLLQGNLAPPAPRATTPRRDHLLSDPPPPPSSPSPSQHPQRSPHSRRSPRARRS